MDEWNWIDFSTRYQTGTNLTWKITGKLLTQLTDKCSMWIWSNKGKVWSYEKYSPKYYNIVHQILHWLNIDTQIHTNLLSIKCKRVVCTNWRNASGYRDIRMLFSTKDITMPKCVKDDQIWLQLDLNLQPLSS